MYCLRKLLRETVPIRRFLYVKIDCYANEVYGVYGVYGVYQTVLFIT